MSDLTERIAALSPRKLALLSKQLKQRREQSVQPQVIGRRAAKNFCPLSFAQERLWLIEQLEPGNYAYNIPDAIRLVGSLDVEAFHRALNEIVRRHEVLRTTFAIVDERPVQVIAPSLILPLPVIDLRHLPESEREPEARRLIAEEARHPFDLSTGPLLRALLLQLGEADNVVLLNMHHIVYDAWSISIFMREMTTFYQAFSARIQATLPELPIQYADFAIWQRERFQAAALESSLLYWKRHLHGAPQSMDLSSDRPRPASQTLSGAHESFRLPDALTGSLRALSRQKSATLFMTLLAAFQTLLSRYSGQEDLVVGTPISGRNRAELEPLIGFFLNVLIIRTDVSGDPGFSELLGRVREVCLGAFAHQDVPFEKLVEELQPQRDLSRSPLFQVLFTVESAAAGETTRPGNLTVRPLKFNSETSKYDLTLALIDDGQELSGTLEYNTDLFETSTALRMLRHFRRLLEGIVADPQRRVSELPLLSEAERHQLLYEWNDTRAPFPAESCIHQLFEAQVERTPDAIALVYEDERLSYRELNSRANQLAHHLRGMGVGIESLVGILLARSVELIVSVLGVLKAGAAYVPLDPAYPQERLSFMIEDAQVSVLLTQDRLADLRPGTAALILRLDTDRTAISQEAMANLFSLLTPEHLVYVIYTSGSTGKPKGVQVPHRAVVNFLDSMRCEPGLTARDCLLSVTSLSFDIAALEIFLPLVVGGSIRLASREESTDALRLSELISASGASVMQATPATWQMLFEAGWKGSKQLTVLCGGEALPRRLANRLRDSSAALWNMYGPTETTIWSTISHLDSDEGAVTIGQPIANTQIYILDERMHLTPVGVPGGLYIGGDGLARGYLNRPELTADRFVPHPLSDTPGARLYRTGDLARWNKAGELVYVGRGDEQVKVRGYRIEMGEVEAALREEAGVAEASVVAVEAAEEGREKQLVAYIVGEDEHRGLTISELRRSLKERLPEHMIPSAFVMLEALPLTPNGKVDRKALPAPVEMGLKTGASFVPPRDFLEFQLTRIWEEIFGRRPIGVTDDFFDLGGQSLMAVRLMAHIERSLGKRLPVVSLFRGATVERLAILLRQQGEIVAPQSPLVEIQAGEKRQPFFCVHPVGGGVYCYVDLAQRLGPDQPFYGLQSPQVSDDDQPPPSRIETLAALYLEALRAVQPAGPYLLGGWSMGGVVAFEMARRLEAGGEQVALLALIDVPAPSFETEMVADGLDILLGFAHELGLSFDEDSPAADHLLRLEPDEQLAYMLEQARRDCRLSPDIEVAQLGHLFRVFKHNARAMRSYRPRPVQCQVTIFRCSEAAARSLQDLTMGWKNLAPEVKVEIVPGDHYSIMRPPEVHVLAERLRECFDRVAANPPE